MRTAYFELTTSASSEEIATFRNSQTQLDGLFNQKRIDVGDFERESIVVGRPQQMDLGVYRFILEINHVHKGMICARGNTCHPCHKKYPEPSSRLKTAGGYGFHGLNPWERWQMMLLYQKLFDPPKFQTHEMLAARRSADHEALTKYVEKMVNVKKYKNRYKTDILFLSAQPRRIEHESNLGMLLHKPL